MVSCLHRTSIHFTPLKAKIRIKFTSFSFTLHVSRRRGRDPEFYLAYPEDLNLHNRVFTKFKDYLGEVQESVPK